MASRSLGTLTIDMVLKTFGLKQGMDKAERDMDAHAKRMKARAEAIGRGIGTAINIGIAGAVAAGGALVAITKSAIDFADHLNDLNQRLGVSAEALSGWAYAARQTGTDIDALGVGLKKLAKNMEAALDPRSRQATIFDALGVKITDSVGNLKSLEDILPEIATQFKALNNATLEAALAQELFGKSGADLMEFLNQGADGLDQMRQRARELGIELDGDTMKAADEFNDTLGDIKTVTEALGLKLAAQLLPLLIDLAKQFRGVATDGTTVSKVAAGVAATFTTVETVLKGVAFFAKFTGEHFAFLALSALNAAEAMKQIPTLGMADGTIAGAMRNQRRNLGQFLGGTVNRWNDYFGNQGATAPSPGVVFAGSGPDPVGMFRYGSGAEAKRAREMEARLNRMLADPTGSGRSGGRSGKVAMSDADREAQRLLQTFNQLTESQKEQIALYGQTSEVSKMLYRTQQGDLAGLAEGQKEVLLAGARRLDQLKEEARLLEESTRRDAERASSLRGVLEAIEDERAQLGMTNDERERYNNLKRLSADASEDERRAVEDATSALQQERKAMDDSIALKDEWRNGMVDAITDVVTGAKSLKEAFTDFFDSLAAMITEMIARRWVEQLFGQAGSNQSGSAGGFLNSLFGALFGGGRASGGPVSSGRVYEVGEGNRPELYMSGGREYMIPGNKGRVVPLSGGGRGMTINQVINVPRNTEYRSAQQVGQAALVSAQRAMLRNA